MVGYNMVYKIKRFFKKLRQAIKGAIVIYKSYSYDWSFLTELLQFAMEENYKEVIINGHAERSKLEELRYKVALQLIKQINETTSEIAFEKTLPEYKEMILIYGEREFEFVPNEHNAYYTIVDKRKENLTKLHLEDLNKREDLIYKKATYRFNKNFKTLFYILNKDLRKWWD